MVFPFQLSYHQPRGMLRDNTPTAAYNAQYGSNFTVEEAIQNLGLE